MLAALIGTACAAPEVTPFASDAPIPPGQARLYVYRPETPVSPAQPNLVWLDGRELAALAPNAYVTLALSPGTHRLDASLHPPDIANATRGRAVDLHPDRATYCRLFGVPSIYGTRWDVRCSDDAEEHADLRSCFLAKLSPAADSPEGND
jgi:hypothetical protein